MVTRPEADEGRAVTINERLRRGEIVESAGKLYRLCGVCRQIVCINKRFFGALHFCLTEDEIAATRRGNQ